MTHRLVFKDQLGNLVDDESALSMAPWARALEGGCVTMERWYQGELIETVAYEVRPLGKVRVG